MGKKTNFEELLVGFDPEAKALEDEGYELCNSSISEVKTGEDSSILVMVEYWIQGGRWKHGGLLRTRPPTMEEIVEHKTFSHHPLLNYLIAKEKEHADVK